jgi:pimeloyl-ACP methyl ester carboxylesterase
MHPGSGPSDRDNDVYFPPIREHLLAQGIAVCSFDKRGVGGSTGRWEDAGIEAQADDALAAVAALQADERAAGPVGLFGHSQGGWVVVEAASRDPDVAFVIASSGPGVTPGEQERYATRTHVVRGGATGSEVEEAVRGFDELLQMLREGTPLEEVRRRLDPVGLALWERLGAPEEADWELMRRLVDYDPRPALEQIRVPVLALFGENDPIVPVEESVLVYEAAVQPDLLTLAVFPGGDHRIQVGDPPRLAEGYLDTVSSFVAAAARPRV